jgi:predicted glycosyltransferase
VRVWIDVTNSPQVPFFLPLIATLAARGHEVEVTSRDYAQTLELLELHAVPYTEVGPGHGGASRAGKARAMVGRMRALRSWAKRRRPDLALSHASHELPLVARSLGIPSAYAFDYEFARIQHGLGCRAARRVVVPEAIPQDRLERLGASRDKVRRYPGLKEEYFLHDFRPDPAVLDELGVDSGRVLVVVRTAAEAALYHRHGNRLFAGVLERLGSDPGVCAVVLPRTADQRDAIRDRGLPSLVLPDHAIDAQSLVALSDLVVSAGGTMNREAVALGVPVYTMFAGRLGAVDEMLVAEGRLRPLAGAEELVIEKRRAVASPPTRDPELLLDTFLTALEG